MDPRQQAQLERFLKWVEEESHIEGPTHLTTIFQPHQVARMEWLKRNATGRILEVGCNVGIVLAWVGGHVGVDINPANVTLARVLSPDREFFVGDARDLPFENRSFDTVMLPEMIEHLDFEIRPVEEHLDIHASAPKAILEARRIARRRILITCPDGRTDSEMACNFKHPTLMDDAHVGRLVDYLWPYRVRVLFKHGFVLVRCDP